MVSTDLVDPHFQNRELEQLADRAGFYADAASARATRRGYASDLRQFQKWCDAQGLAALPASPATVVLYLTDQADLGKAVATLERALISIRKSHLENQLDDPTAHAAVKTLMKGIRNDKGVAQKKAAPLLVEPLKKIVGAMNFERLKDLRDRALLCLGFATGMRRSELVGLDVEHLVVEERGLAVQLGRTKSDQQGAGRKVVVFRGASSKTCPVAAVQDWLTAAGIVGGPVFVEVTRHGHVRTGKRVTDQVVALVLKRRAEAAGMDAAQLSGHSLRAGLATQAAMNGALERDIAKQTGHRSDRILRGYIRDADLWRNNVTEALGL